MTDQLSSDLASLRIDRAAPAPEGGRGPVRVLLWLVIGGAALAGAYTVARPRLEARFFKTTVEVTEISTVSPAQASIELSSTGYVVPQINTMVGAKIPGRVAQINVKEGDRVEANDVLMVLDSADQEAQRRSAESRVAATRARVQSALASLAEVQIQLDRELLLVKEGLSPKANADNLAARVKALQAGVKAAEAEVAAAASEVRAITVNLDYLTIRSPISGMVVSKTPQLGELVGALTLTPLTIEIADMTSIVVETDVPEARLEQVKARAPTEIVLDAFPSRRFRGEVREVSPKVNRQKATVQVKVGFVDATEGVLPDMSARVSFLARPLDAEAMKAPPKVVVPREAVADRAGGKVVYVLEGDKVRMVPITLGPAFGGGFEVASGPPPGTRLVRSPPTDLADGQRIKEKSLQ